MKRHGFLAVMVLLMLFLCLTVGTDRSAAQGPAGAGASAAAKDTSSHGGHSLNPIKWVKKDSKKSADSRSEIESKLTPKLQAQGLLTAKANLSDTCSQFVALNECVASLHASKSLEIDFNCLRADVTGVFSNVDLSGCKGPIGDKAQSLAKAIHLLKPDADAKGAARDAERQAKDDLKEVSQ